MDFALLLWELDRSGLQQAFGPYASQDLADEALVELGNWPSLHGAWEIMPLTQAGLTDPATAPPPVPYTPTFPPLPAPQPQWPYSPVIWCGSEPTQTAAYVVPGWTGCAPATTPHTIWTTGMPPSPQDEPPDMAVPARV
jgi:hypothetical protein